METSEYKPKCQQEMCILSSRRMLASYIRLTKAKFKLLFAAKAKFNIKIVQVMNYYWGLRGTANIFTRTVIVLLGLIICCTAFSHVFVVHIPFELLPCLACSATAYKLMCKNEIDIVFVVSKAKRIESANTMMAAKYDIQRSWLRERERACGKAVHAFAAALPLKLHALISIWNFS